MVMLSQVSWLFFKARAKRPYLDSYGSSEQRGKTANWPAAHFERYDIAIIRKTVH